MQQLINRLTRLDPLEQLAKKYFVTTGKELEFSKGILLNQCSNADFSHLTQLNSPQFEEKSRQLRAQFTSLYQNTGLSDSVFIQPEHSIEIEKLLRFVSIPSHHHDFIELVYVIAGHCNHTVHGSTYRQGPGCLTFIVSHAEHELHADEDCLCLTVKVRNEKFAEFLIPNLPYLSLPISFDCGDDRFMRELMLSMYEQQEAAGCYHREIMDHLFQAFLIYCMQNYRDTLRILHTNTPQNGKMLEMINYMYENHPVVTLNSLAQRFGYSASYLSRMFRNNVGESFSSVLRGIKMDRAKKLLQTTNMKLNDICHSVGYADTAQFIRDYKKRFNCTPAKYRRDFHRNSL